MIGFWPKYSDLTPEDDGFSYLKKALVKVVQDEFGFNA